MPVVKKSTKAAKSAKTAKPAAKKSTATKKTVTAKKTTTSKKSTVTKKAAAPKAAAKPVSTELSVTGNKKIETLMKEFNKKFPYLRLGIFYSYARQAVAKGERITPIDRDKTLASVRRADSGGDISISGNKKVKSLENEFDKVFGLYCQVCYTRDGHRYYSNHGRDELTLSALNSLCEDEGCEKGAWK